MRKIFNVKKGDEIITLEKGHASEDAEYFNIDTIRIKMKKTTKESLRDAQNTIVHHKDWWGIEVRCDDEVSYLSEEGEEEDDFRTDIEYYRVSSDSIILFTQHKHNSGAQIESESFEII
jgi:hypothetical protein